MSENRDVKHQASAFAGWGWKARCQESGIRSQKLFLYSVFCPLASVLWPLILVFLFLLTLSSLGLAETYHWKILGVVDGDTLRVEVPGLPPELSPVSVRVLGVDTPERGGKAKCGSERDAAERATDFTRSAVAQADKVQFTDVRWDKYGGRILARVWIGRDALADRLIAEGLGRPYDGGKRSGWCGGYIQ